MSLSTQIKVLGSLPSAGSPPAASLSADEIAVLLGFTDAADFTAALAAKIAAATLTTNGDLLTRTAGVPARLALGSALQVLRVNAGATALEFAAAASGDPTARHCSCYRDTTGSTLTANTWIDITFAQELYDTDAFHSTVSNTDRFTIPTGLGGTYVFWAYVQVSPVGANQMWAAPAKNGTKISNQYVQWYVPTTAVYNGHFVYWVITLAQADYVTLQLKSAGSNAYLHGTGDVTDGGTKCGLFRIGA